MTENPNKGENMRSIESMTGNEHVVEAVRLLQKSVDASPLTHESLTWAQQAQVHMQLAEVQRSKKRSAPVVTTTSFSLGRQ